MKSLIKKITAIVILFSLITSMAGCSRLEVSETDLLIPPKANGEMFEIQTVLEKNIGHGYTLKYPEKGEYRSAYIMADLMEIGKKNFVIAFYSVLSDENIATMHMSLLKKVNDDWVFLSDISMSATGVEKVEIIDLNGDGVKEIVVGWNVFSGVDKKLMVYGHEGLKLIPLLQESYNKFISCDLNEDGQNGLLLIEHNTVNSTASVKLYNFNKKGVEQTGNCILDGTATSFSEPVVSFLTTGKKAVFIDAVKAGGMQTEVVTYENGILNSPFYNEDPAIPSRTYRESTVAAMDINGDGCMDIPSITNGEISPDSASFENISQITVWKSFNGLSLRPVEYTVMNYADGYYTAHSWDWLKNVTVTRNTESRLSVYSLWDAEKGEYVSELFRIRTIPEAEWERENNGYPGYQVIAKGSNVVYVVLISGFEGGAQKTLEEIKKEFFVIR